MIEFFILLILVTLFFLSMIYLFYNYNLSKGVYKPLKPNVTHKILDHQSKLIKNKVRRELYKKEIEKVNRQIEKENEYIAKINQNNL